MSEHLTFDQYEYRQTILKYLQNRSLPANELHQALLYLPEDMFLRDPLAQTMTHFLLVNAFDANPYERFINNTHIHPLPPLQVRTSDQGYLHRETFLLNNPEHIYFFKPSYLPLTTEEKERAQELEIPLEYYQYAKPLQRVPLLGGFVQQYDDRQTSWTLQDEHAFPSRWESMKMQYTHFQHSLSTFLDNPTK